MKVPHVEILKPFCNFKEGELYPIRERDDGKSFIKKHPFCITENDKEWRERKGFIRVVMHEVRKVRDDL